MNMDRVDCNRLLGHVVVLPVGCRWAACFRTRVEQHVLARRHGSRGSSVPRLGTHLELQRGMSAAGLTAIAAPNAVVNYCAIDHAPSCCRYQLQRLSEF